ncbi:MAG: hypothetical protein LBJ11_04615 [Oscillospiraceae bacterium]|nr:hypothetical protein [Oscillospiraceae bacterium]
MGKQIRCRLTLADRETHSSQVLAGFRMLERRGMLRIADYRETDLKAAGQYEHRSVVEAEIEGKRLAYDTADGYQSIHRFDVWDAQLDRLDAYFKRSCRTDYHNGMKNATKIRPLGLNYHISCPRNPFDKPAKESVPATIKRRLLHYYTAYYPECFAFYEHFEAYRALFVCRLWDASGISAAQIQEAYPYFSAAQAKAEAERWTESLEGCNRNRIAVLRALQEGLGDQFFGGLEASPLAERLARDLILPTETASKAAHMRRMREGFVCIATEGLHHSLGWKLGEAVAASKAILSEPLFYELPGEFLPAQNYIPFSTPEDCVTEAARLLSDVSRIHAMETANHTYYEKHVRPDCMIANSLREAAIFPEGQSK